MAESFASRRMRWGFNLFPAYRGTGARITYISSDYREVRVRLPLSWRTRNYVGTIFGGSLYGAVDPIYMIMLIKILGPGYAVWDKSATIRFRRPGRGTLFGRFFLPEEEIRTIRELADRRPSIDRLYTVDLADAEGVVHASFEKTIYIRKGAKAA
jgi:acyl-coenzyme A thioesterase PaaI-like protein